MVAWQISSFFFVSEIKHHDQEEKKLIKEFILAYHSRGLESIKTGTAGE